MAPNADVERKDGQAPPDWARRAGVRPSEWRADGSSGPRVTIVGPCAAGKTTLVTRLQARGYDAHAVAQEHSGVPYLWQLSEPDLLVFLDVDLAATTARRQREWPTALHDTQQARLAHARAHADLYLDSSPLTPDAVAERVAGFIQGGAGRRAQV
jgi:predicted ATPase